MPGIQRKDLIPLGVKWRDERKKSGNIMASNVGSCLGINKKDRFQGFEQIENRWKIMRDPSLDTFDGNYYTRRGLFYEKTTLNLFQTITKKKVHETTQWQSTEYDWLYATPDGIIDDDIGLEAKNPYGYAQKIPPYDYIAQMHVQMHCSNRKQTYFISTSFRYDIVEISLMDFSEPFWEWMIPQLKYFRDTAIDPQGILDLNKFDMNPPYVYVQHVATNIISNLIDDIPVFPEESPTYTPRRIFHDIESDTKKRKKQ